MSTVQTNMINTEDVIKEVSTRRCLWDPSSESYKNRDKRYKAWMEVATVTIKNFQDMDREEQAEMVEKIQQRWRHARDGYSKTRSSLKKSQNDPSNKTKKMYVFYERLRFLDELENSIESETDTMDFSFANDDENSSVSNPPAFKDVEKISSDPPPLKENPRCSIVFGLDQGEDTDTRKRKCEDKYENVNDELKNQLLEILSASSQKLDDSDISFFNSILPMVRELNNFEKLLFRSKVINELLNMQKTKKTVVSNVNTISNIVPKTVVPNVNTISNIAPKTVVPNVNILPNIAPGPSSTPGKFIIVKKKAK